MKALVEISCGVGTSQCHGTLRTSLFWSRKFLYNSSRANTYVIPTDHRFTQNDGFRVRPRKAVTFEAK
jgi:hypothetical protein